jgi:hypothetical protein
MVPCSGACPESLPGPADGTGPVSVAKSHTPSIRLPEIARLMVRHRARHASVTDQSSAARDQSPRIRQKGSRKVRRAA